MGHNLSRLFVNLKRVMPSAAVPHLSIANGRFTLIDGENTADVTNLDENKLMFTRVIFLDANPNMSKVWYESKWDPNAEETKAPDCWSDDGVEPASSCTNKQSATCQSCEQNVWGSKISEKGSKVKACRDYIKTAVLVPEFSMDKVFQFRVAPNSLKNFAAYVAKIEDIPPVDGYKLTIGDIATFITFDPDQVGTVDFLPAEPEPEETEAARALEGHHDIANVCGLTNVQVDNSLPAPTKTKAIENKSGGQPKVTKAVTKKAPVEEVEEDEDEVEEVKPAPKPMTKAPLKLATNNVAKTPTKTVDTGMRTKLGVASKSKLASDEEEETETAGIPSTAVNMPPNVRKMLAGLMS